MVLPLLKIENKWKKEQGGHLPFIREKRVKFVLKDALSTLSTLNPFLNCYRDFKKMINNIFPQGSEKCLQGGHAGHSQVRGKY